MKQLVLLLLFPCLVFSQTYPFKEGFEGLNPNMPPPGWGGSMKVLVDHGRNNTKGLAARVSSADPIDTAITPLIGPLTSSSFISFFYRVIDFAFYPEGNSTEFAVGDEIEMFISTDNISYNQVMLIDMNNHNKSFGFVKKKIILTQYAGNSVYFKIICRFGTGAAYYVDFDTIVVDNDPSLGIEDVSNAESIFLYPNPCNSHTTLGFEKDNFESTELQVFNSVGIKVLENKFTGNYQLPVSNLPIGIYFVHVSDGTRRITRKLIVQR